MAIRTQRDHHIYGFWENNNGPYHPRRSTRTYPPPRNSRWPRLSRWVPHYSTLRNIGWNFPVIPIDIIRDIVDTEEVESLLEVVMFTAQYSRCLSKYPQFEDLKLQYQFDEEGDLFAILVSGDLRMIIWHFKERGSEITISVKTDHGQHRVIETF